MNKQLFHFSVAQQLKHVSIKIRILKPFFAKLSEIKRLNISDL